MGKDRGLSGMDFGVRVGAVVERGGALLLVRHRKPGREPYWVLPGGRLEPGETVPGCAEREVAEETGLSARFLGVLYVSEFLRGDDGSAGNGGSLRHTIDVTTRMAVEGDEEAFLGSDPEVAPGSEPTLSELRWIGAEELGGIELLPPSLKDRLLRDAARGWPAGDLYLGRSGD